jgi:hypothetical protein
MVEREPVGDAAATVVAGHREPDRSKPSRAIAATMSAAMARLA